MIEELKSVKIMFDHFEDLSLGFVPAQIEEAERIVQQLEALDIEGKEDEIKDLLSNEERHAIIKAYCFVPSIRNHKYMFLRVT